jgi:hypothetical protein
VALNWAQGALPNLVQQSATLTSSPDAQHGRLLTIFEQLTNIKKKVDALHAQRKKPRYAR